MHKKASKKAIQWNSAANSWKLIYKLRKKIKSVFLKPELTVNDEKWPPFWGHIFDFHGLYKAKSE